MKLLIKLSVGVLIVILLYEIGLNLLNKYYTTSTRGEKIAAYEKTNSALLVIDIQEDLTGKNAKAPYPYKNSDDFIDKVNTVTNLAKKKGYLIIYIRQEFSNKLVAHFLSGGRLLKGKPGTR